MLSVALIICVLLIVNGLLVKTFVSLNMPDADTRIQQALQFVLPVVMIFIEFWFYDMVNRQSNQ